MAYNLCHYSLVNARIHDHETVFYSFNIHGGDLLPHLSVTLRAFIQFI